MKPEIEGIAILADKKIKPMAKKVMPDTKKTDLTIFSFLLIEFLIHRYQHGAKCRCKVFGC